MSELKISQKKEYLEVFFGLYEDKNGVKKTTPLYFNIYQVAYFLHKKIENKEISYFNMMAYYIEKSNHKKYILKYIESKETQKTEEDSVIEYRKIKILDLSPSENSKDIKEELNKYKNLNFTLQEFEINLANYENEEVVNDLHRSEYFIKTESADLFRLPIINARKVFMPNEDPAKTITYFFGQIEYSEKGNQDFTLSNFEITELAPTYMEAAYLAQEKINKMKNKEIYNIKINMCHVDDDDYFDQEYFLTFKKIEIKEKLENGKWYEDVIYDFYMPLYKKIEDKEKFIEEENEFIDITSETIVDIITLKSQKYTANEISAKKLEKFVYSEKSEMLDDAIDLAEESYEEFLEELNNESVEIEEISNYYEDKPLLKQINRIIQNGKSDYWLESLNILKLLYLSEENFDLYLEDINVSCQGFKEIFNYIEVEMTSERKEPFVLMLSKDSGLSIGDKKVILMTALYLDKYAYIELPNDIVNSIKKLLGNVDTELKYITNSEFFKRIKIKN